MSAKTNELRSMASPIIRITQESPDQQPTSSLTTDFEEKCHEPDQQSEVSSISNKNKQMPTKSISKNSATATSSSEMDATHAYRKRWLILTLFCSHSAINSFQWIEYSSITSVIAQYHGVSNMQVNLTSLIYMVTYIPFIIHASLMLERVGLRKAVVLGTLGTALGSLIKWLLGNQPGISGFYWMMLGQTVVALSQLYIISIPPLLAAVWFPDHQVSTATGIGVFGNQVGIALGFIVPPWVIGDPKATVEVLGADLSKLAGAVFWVSFAIGIASILLFDEKPPKPPGSASLHAEHQHQANQQHNQTTNSPKSALASTKELCADRDFNKLILSYGINVGVFYAVSTVLNQMVAASWPQKLDLAGTMGLLIVVSGMVGSVICGQLLDRTHAFKIIIVLIYLLSLVAMLLFTLVIHLFTEVWPLYVVSITLGFFMTGYLPLGFEFAAEITYPHSANTPAGLLNLSAQVFGFALTTASSNLVDNMGDLCANIFLTISLAVGFLLTMTMKADLKRQKAVAEEQMKI